MTDRESSNVIHVTQRQMENSTVTVKEYESGDIAIEYPNGEKEWINTVVDIRGKHDSITLPYPGEEWDMESNPRSERSIGEPDEEVKKEGEKCRNCGDRTEDYVETADGHTYCGMACRYEDNDE